MFGNLLSIAVLASSVLVPLTLRRGGCTITSVCETPSGTAMRRFYFFVIVLQLASAVAWLGLRFHVFGEPVMLWTTSILLSSSFALFVFYPASVAR